jgi:hypothetical protein
MRRAPRWLVLFATLVAQAAWAQVASRIEASEPGVKAAFLYKFASYVEWPASALGSPEAPFVIAVSGADDVAAELERILPGKLIHGHPAVVRRLREGESISGVHLLFVGRGQPSVRAMPRAAQQPGTLLVSESERGLELGSAINFVSVDDRIGFEVSVDAAERNGLKVSSRMLNVARRVVTRQ